jgi:hypothetical protein
MATPAPQPTRQQLDDLDALLQRMLALPVNPAEEPTPPAPPPPEVPAFPETLAPPAGNMILADPVPFIPPDPVAASPIPVSIPLAAPPPAAALPLPLFNPVPPAERRGPVLPQPDRPLSGRQALIASRPPAPPLLLRPVLWLNRQFDGLAFGLGAPGRWLRRPVGRTLLGIAGLALLAAAVALALLDRIGWTW